jgi:hypothetical protein
VKLGVSLAELDRWDPDAVHHVFEAAIARAEGTRSAATGIGDVMTTVPGSGQTQDAAQAAAGRIRIDLLAHAEECEAVGRAAATAEAGIRAIKSDWQRIQRMADKWGFTIDLDTNEISYAAARWSRVGFDGGQSNFAAVQAMGRGCSCLSADYGTVTTRPSVPGPRRKSRQQASCRCR